MNSANFLWLRTIILVAAVSSSVTFAAGGPTTNMSKDEENQIRKAIDTLEEEELSFVLKGDEMAATREWSEDLAVNAPSNQIRRKPEILKLMEQHTGLQYSSFQRHREAIVIRRDCVVSMGYELVVPKGNVPDSGKTINRRYTNVYYLDDGGWRLVARQATNVSVK